MKIFSKIHIIFSIITFIIIFLMNYLGNDNDDRLGSAVLNALAGVIGLGIGLFILYKGKSGKGSDRYDNFD